MAIPELLAHYCECPGCELCDHLVEFYQSCDNENCGLVGDIDACDGWTIGENGVYCSNECLEEAGDTLLIDEDWV